MTQTTKANYDNYTEARAIADHEAAEDLLTFFSYDHLPEHLQEISRPFHDLAHECAMVEHVYPDQFRTGLQKLLEAKDCMVRAGLNDQELTRKSRPNLVWAIKRVCETKYVLPDQPVYYATIRKILKQAGLRTTNVAIRSALAIAGCPGLENDKVDGSVLLEFMEGVENKHTEDLEKERKSG